MSRIYEKHIQGARSVSHSAICAPWISPTRLIRELGLPGSGTYILLDSAGGNPHLCRYSFLAWDSRLELTVREGKAAISSSDGHDPADMSTDHIEVSDPFALLRLLLADLTPEVVAGANEAGMPVAGGAFGMLGYDAGRYIENLPSLATDDLGLPEFHLIFPRKLICYDHQAGTAHLFFEDPAAGEMASAEEALRVQSLSREAFDEVSAGRHEFSLSYDTQSNMTQESFMQIVERAKEYIIAGDIFQSNLSQRLELEYDGDSLVLYEALRAVNPSPFAGFLDMGDYQLISSSPERLVQLDGREAQTRPIAGTRRRGVDNAEDDNLREELNLDPKERAEHIMLVDLERNDMGRVCDYGSVRVDELMVNEAYSHVTHIVSNVQGELYRTRDAVDLLRAMFPGGTITGCPKVRCMEIIDELEPVRRGPYTGSFGYIGYNGNMDMNIIIRTLVRIGDSVFVQAGAGIVADSDPEREYRETLRKAEAMVRAVHLAKNTVPDAEPMI
ncbi:MAG: anthranilate synthase component I family protein [Thermoleophilia bacterium]|jgi:aminodeoxychorismate synthase component I